jgi:hypothetical protein
MPKCNINCLLLSFAGPSLGVVKHVLNNINVVESFPASGRFIKCTITTYLLRFDSFNNSTVEKQCTTVVRVVRDVCVSLQQFSGESSGVDTLADKVLEHHGLHFAINNHINIAEINRRYEHVIKAKKAGRANESAKTDRKERDHQNLANKTKEERESDKTKNRERVRKSRTNKTKEERESEKSISVRSARSYRRTDIHHWHNKVSVLKVEINSMSNHEII